MDTCYGRYIMRIEGTDGAHIVGNQITGSFSVKMDNTGNVLWLLLAKKITLQNNTVANQGPFAGQVVALDKSVDASEVTGNDDSGIVVKSSTP
jgi:hypothetical protein